MKVPALAARAPLGATNDATGTGEARMALMISRIEVSRPPGVSMRSTTSCVPSAAAHEVRGRRTDGAFDRHHGHRRGCYLQRPREDYQQDKAHRRLAYRIDPVRCEA